MLLSAHVERRLFKRRHGEIRPSVLWLVIGVGVFVFMATMAVCCASMGSPVLTGLFTLFAGIGAGMVGYYYHRRIQFRRRAVYDIRAGQVRSAVPYSCAWQCQLGENIEREGIIIQGVGARTWAIPGATSREALSEALWCLREAGVKLPDSDALVKRFGITQAMIEQSGRGSGHTSL